MAHKPKFELGQKVFTTFNQFPAEVLEIKIFWKHSSYSGTKDPVISYLCRLQFPHTTKPEFSSVDCWFEEAHVREC